MNKFLQRLEDNLHKATGLSDYVIEIGVVDTNTHRKEMMSIGLTNAEVLYINEHGSHVNHMPARPVLHMTIHWATKFGLIRDTLQKCVDGVLKKEWSQKDVENELNRMCERMQKYCRDLIMNRDRRLARNAPSTIKAKGFDHPLLQTSQLVGSITCRAVKKQDI